MMKEYGAFDNLPAKQSRWEISPHTARDLSWMRQPASDKSSAALISLRPFEVES
jgi:hypothetical protein